MNSAGNAALGSRQIERAEGLAFARAWRVKNKPVFDALYGASPACGCGATK